jgi:predicted dehydrogenase
MPGERVIRAAVVGAGFIGAVHVDALRRLGVHVAGVLASTPASGAKRAAQLGVDHGYADLDALLNADVDAVHVASPNHLHHAQVAAILASGRHVICEKPLAVTAGESAHLAQLAADSGLVHAVNFNLRYYPVNQHASEVVRDGRAGDVRLVSGHYLQDWLLEDTDWNWRVSADLGGALRAVGDLGSHWLDLVQFVTGQRVVAAFADLATFIPERRRPTEATESFRSSQDGQTEGVAVTTEDAATILLRLSGGARGVVAISQVSPGRKNSLRYEIDGSDAAVAWDSEQPDQRWVGHRDAPNEILLRNPRLMGALGRAASRLPAGHVEGFADTFAALFSAIYADIRAGRPSEHPSYPTFRDGHDAMLIGDAVAESARTGRWATVARAEPAAVRPS